MAAGSFLCGIEVMRLQEPLHGRTDVSKRRDESCNKKHIH